MNAVAHNEYRYGFGIMAGRCYQHRNPAYTFQLLGVEEMQKDITTKKADRAPIGAAEKFIRNVLMGPHHPERCVIFPYRKDPDGYGRMLVSDSKGKKWSTSASRVVMLMIHGDLPSTTVARHKCKNRDCCSPLHIEIGSSDDNAKDRARDGTLLKGEKHPCALLNDSVVQAIHKFILDGGGINQCSDKFGVKRMTIRDIVSGATWPHLGLECIDMQKRRARRYRCIVDGVEYESANDASKATGFPRRTINNWLSGATFRRECHYIGRDK